MRAPSPNGRCTKSNSATVASVRTKMLIHIGRMNRITVICERFNSLLLRMYAAGYPSRIHRNVVTRAMPIE